MDYGYLNAIPSRPYDLHSAQIKKSDDLDNACAKSRVLEALLAQAVAMQIISTPGMSHCRKWERSGRWRPSAPCRGSARSDPGFREGLTPSVRMRADELPDALNGLLALREYGGKDGPDVDHIVPDLQGHLNAGSFRAVSKAG